MEYTETVIRFDGPMGEYGFLSAPYPSPFSIGGNRYRTLYQYILQGGDLYDGLMAKYRSNPTLAVMLRMTGSVPLRYTGTNPSLRGIDILTMKIRDSVLVDTTIRDDNTIMFDNLYQILAGQGYSTITSMEGKPCNIPIEDGPREDYQGMTIRGMYLEGDKEKTIEAIVDVFIKGGYTDERLKYVIGRMSANRDKKDSTRYFVVTTLSRQLLSKFLRVSAFNNVKLFAPAELFTSRSKHMLTPRMERVLPSDSIYPILRSIEDRLPEISSDDKLVNEKGFSHGDIVIVEDFSPHYRIVV